MNVKGIHHLALLALDVERLAGFYRDTLGLPEQARHFYPDGRLRSVWLTLPDGGFLAVEPASKVGPMPEDSELQVGPGYHLLAFRISSEDRARWMAELAAKGVAVPRQTRWTFYVQDPERNWIGFSHHPEEPRP